jgi:hypothetical protein
MNTGYLLYLAERPMSACEQRQVDIQNAELYASLDGLLRSLTTPLRGARQRRARNPGSPAPSFYIR